MLDDNVKTEELILMAAEREFVAKGFAGARTTAIAEAAGVTHAMLNYYFRSKRKLYERIISEKIALLEDAVLRPAEDESWSLEEILRSVIDRHIDFIAANPGMPRIITGEMFANTDTSRRIQDQFSKLGPKMVAALQRKLDEAACEGKIRQTDARSLILDIASLNIFPYVATPLINAAFGYRFTESNDFVERRKRENFDTIMRKLKL